MFLSWGPLLHLQRSCLGSAPHRASSADHTGKGYLPLRALGLHQAHRVVQHALPSQGPSTHLLSPFAMEGHVCPGPGTWMGISLASMIPLTTYVGKSQHVPKAGRCRLLGPAAPLTSVQSQSLGSGVVSGGLVSQSTGSLTLPGTLPASPRVFVETDESVVTTSNFGV